MGSREFGYEKTADYDEISDRDLSQNRQTDTFPAFCLTRQLINNSFVSSRLGPFLDLFRVAIKRRFLFHDGRTMKQKPAKKKDAYLGLLLPKSGRAHPKFFLKAFGKIGGTRETSPVRDLRNVVLPVHDEFFGTV